VNHQAPSLARGFFSRLLELIAKHAGSKGRREAELLTSSQNIALLFSIANALPSAIVLDKVSQASHDAHHFD
jgi:hypothetical protein